MLLSMDSIDVRVHEAGGDPEYCTDPICARYQTRGRRRPSVIGKSSSHFGNFEASWRVLPDSADFHCPGPAIV